MNLKVTCLSILILAVSACNGAPPGLGNSFNDAPVAQKTADQVRLETDVRALSSDEMAGREAGTAGFDQAADYVARRFADLGLKPGGGDGTYFQNVPMVEYGRVADFGGIIDIPALSTNEKFVAGENYFISASSTMQSGEIEAPVVFVGFGLVAPEYSRDDYEGLDVEGKIVAFLAGAPKFLGSEQRAHYGSTRAQVASDRGAIGSITLMTPSLENRISFARILANIVGDTSMSWRNKDGNPFSRSPNLLADAFFSREAADLLFQDATSSWAEIEAAAEAEAGDVKGFELGVTARIQFQSFQRNLETANVIGILPGSDPTVAGEYIVITGHLDHEGTKPTAEEGDDEIYNGAMDNAVGIAAIMEIARLISDNPARRPIMFTALTAEEKGLVGSDYLARNPPLTSGEIAANINLDMPILTYDFSDIVAFGGERSTMYPFVKKAVERSNLALSPDPLPEQGFFTRSDQYRFVQQGIPSLYMEIGFGNGGEAAQNDFLNNHYHQASDEADLVNYQALQKFTQVNYEVVRSIANMPERPLWKKDDFFGTTFAGPMEK